MAGDHVEGALARAGWPEGDLPRVGVAVGEAVANAVEHGPDKSSEPIRLRCDVGESVCTIWIEDGGPGPHAADLASARLPTDPLAQGGRGLYILATLADEARVEPSGALVLEFVARR